MTVAEKAIDRRTGQAGVPGDRGDCLAVRLQMVDGRDLLGRHLDATTGRRTAPVHAAKPRRSLADLLDQLPEARSMEVPATVS